LLKGELAPLLMLRDIRDGVVFLENGHIGIGINVYFPPSRLKTDEERAAAMENMAILARQVLPIQATLRLYVEAVEKDPEFPPTYLELLQNAEGAVRDINSARVDALKLEAARGRLRQWHTSLTVTWIPSILKTAKSSYTMEEFQTLKRESRTLMTAIESVLADAGIRTRLMDDKELEALLYRYYNPSIGSARPGGGSSVVERILHSRVDNRLEDRLRIGNTWVGAIYLAKGPTRTFPGVLDPVMGLGGEFLLIAEINHPDQFEISSRLNTIRSRLESISADMGSRADPELTVRARVLAEGLERRARTGEHAVEMGVVIFVRAGEPSELYSRVNNLYGQLQVMPNARVIKKIPAIFEFWLAGAPFSGKRLPRHWVCLDMNAAQMLPTRTPWRGSPNPLAWYLTLEGNLVGINPFDERAPAWNGVVIGGSGSGKTFFTQSYITSFLLEGKFVAIIDKGGGYVPLCQLLGGEIIYFSAASQVTINPFDLPEGEHVPSQEKKFFLLTLLRQIIPSRSPALEATEQAILLSAIDRVYLSLTQEVVGPDGTTQKRLVRSPTLSDFRRVLTTLEETFGQSMGAEERELAKQMAQALAVWTGNTPFGRLIDGPTSIDIKNRLIYFETTGISSSPELERVGLLLLMELLWARIARDPAEKKMVVFDEIWSLLASPMAARYVDDFYRRLRRYNAGALSCTQKLQDFEEGHAKGIITNSYYFFMLAAPDQKPVLERLLGLPEDVTSAYARIPPKGQFLFLLRSEGGFEGDFLRYTPSGYEFGAFGTSPKEQERRARMIEDYGSIEAAVRAWHLSWLAGDMEKAIASGQLAK